MLVLIILIALPTAAALALTPLWIRQARAHERQREAQRRDLLIHDAAYQSAVERERAHYLQREKLALEKFRTLHLIAPGSYLINHEVTSMIAFPSLRSADSAAAQVETSPAIIYEQPSLVTIIEELRTNALEFVYGIDPISGELAKTTLPQAVHIQLLGASGQGKSRQATSLLTQLCARNDPAHLQLALIDCEGETTAPFAALPHVRFVADEPKEAARTFRGLVSELERRDSVRVVYPVILVFVEEFLNLRRTMPGEYRDQALEDYTTLALRGRKRGMFLFSIGQTAYVEKAIRDAQNQFLSSMAFACKPTAARSAGFTNTELLNRLYSERRPGQFLLERPAGDNILLAPYVDPIAVSDLLSNCFQSGFQVVSETAKPTEISTAVESSLKADTKPTEPALDARSAHIRDLLSKRVSQREIIKAIWGVSVGANYTKAQAELSAIIATLL